MTRRKPAPVDYVRRPPVGTKTGAESIGYTPPLDPDLAAAARRECLLRGAYDLLEMLGLDHADHAPYGSGLGIHHSAGLRSFLNRDSVSSMDAAQTRRTVAGEVRASLARAGQTAAWLATNAHISKTALSLKLKGQRSLTVEELVSVASALGVDPAGFVAIEDVA